MSLQHHKSRINYGGRIKKRNCRLQRSADGGQPKKSTDPLRVIISQRGVEAICILVSISEAYQAILLKSAPMDP